MVLTLAAMAGLAAWFAAMGGRFDEPRWAYNTWFRLAVVGVATLIVGAIMAVFGHRAARRVQFCLLLSLLLHWGMGAYSQRMHLSQAGIGDSDAETPSSDLPLDLRKPDFRFEYEETEVEERRLDEPLEVKPEATVAKLDRQAEADPSAREKPVPVIEVSPEIKPSPVEMARNEPTAARRAELPSLGPLGRQSPQTADPASAPIPEPQVAPIESPKAPAFAPNESRAAVEHNERTLPRAEAAAPQMPAAPQADVAPSLVRPTNEFTVTLPVDPATPLRTELKSVAELPTTVPTSAMPTPAAPMARAEPGTQPAPFVGGPAAPRRSEEIVFSYTRPEISSRELRPSERSALAPSALARRPEPRASDATMPDWTPGTSAMAGRSPRAAEFTPTVDLPANQPGPAKPADSAAAAVPRPGPAVALARSEPGAVLDRRAPVSDATVPGTRPSTLEVLAGRDRAPSGPPSDMPGGAAAPQVGRAQLSESPAATVAGDAPEPVRPSTATAPPSGPSPTARWPAPAAATAGAFRPPEGLSGRMSDSTLSLAGDRRTESSGMSETVRIEPGLPSRLARPESEVVRLDPQRFVLPRTEADAAIEGRADLPAEFFKKRDPGSRAKTAIAYGGSAGTERAVEAGLAYLAAQQFPDGRWCLDRTANANQKDPYLGQMRSDSAATALALLPFLGAGYTHREEKHRDTVTKGIRWLLQNQKANGDLFSGGSEYCWFYSHALASIVLSEAYGMTRERSLREPAGRAVQFIAASQNREFGGWRYRPGLDADTSVSGWQLMALASARMAGLDVPREPLERVGTWLDRAQGDASGALYVYNPNARLDSEERFARQPNLAMTAEGLLMRMYLGWQREHPGLRAGADHLRTNLPAMGDPNASTRDAYYWYYGTQVMFHIQGPHWQAWRDRLFSLLEKSQLREGPFSGSWDPYDPSPDRWADAAGRLYVTSLNLLMLEVTYRHLPLFSTLSERKPTNHP